MSNVGPEGRSYARIEKVDLDRLAMLAAADRADFFSKHTDWRARYEHRHFATALCQGAALHMLRSDIGIQDFDVYSFYAADPRRSWYAKRRKVVDFGDPKFGQSLDKPNFIGRRVDLLGRGIPHQLGENSEDAIRNWLRAGQTETSRLLAAKAVVLLDPPELRGKMIWPETPRAPAI